jgi:hypothetical protein
MEIEKTKRRSIGRRNTRRQKAKLQSNETKRQQKKTHVYRVLKNEGYEEE